MTFVIAINARGEKQRIPADWIGHPKLGKNFRLPESLEAGVPQVIGNRRPRKRATRGPAATKKAATKKAATKKAPVSGGDTEKEN